MISNLFEACNLYLRKWILSLFSQRLILLLKHFYIFLKLSNEFLVFSEIYINFFRALFYLQAVFSQLLRLCLLMFKLFL